jgi:hypothetical protein
MAEQFIHKYVLEFGQPISFYSADAPVGLPLLSATTSASTAIDRSSLKKDGVVRLSQHNMSFSVAKGKDASQETSISIYNISDDVRLFLEQNNGKKPVIILRAGYETDILSPLQSELPILFAGEVIQVVDTFDGHTRKTSLTCASGTTAIQEAYSIKTFKAGTLPKDIMKSVMADLKLPEGTVYFPDTMSVGINKPVVYTGPSIEFLRKFSKDYSMRVWIEDGTVNTVPTDIVAGAYTKAFVISSDTNMIGSPSVKTSDSGMTEQSKGNRQNVTVTTTLNGAFVIGAKVDLTSKYHSGIYEIESINHQGTYEGSDWNSSLELKPVDGWEK